MSSNRLALSNKLKEFRGSIEKKLTEGALDKAIEEIAKVTWFLNEHINPTSYLSARVVIPNGFYDEAQNFYFCLILFFYKMTPATSAENASQYLKTIEDLHSNLVRYASSDIRVAFYDFVIKTYKHNIPINQIESVFQVSYTNIVEKGGRYINEQLLLFMQTFAEKNTVSDYYVTVKDSIIKNLDKIKIIITNEELKTAAIMGDLFPAARAPKRQKTSDATFVAPRQTNN